MLTNRRGIVLITAFLAIALILILSGIFFMSSLTEQRASQRQLAVTTAFYLAEGGIDDAIAKLRTDNNYPGSAPAVIQLGTQGEFETKVTQPGPVNQPDSRRIESWGYTPSKDQTAYGYQVKKLEAYVTVTPNPLFMMAIFTEDEIEMNGSGLLDSYDSSKGVYDPANAGSDADIGSNNKSKEEPVIQIKGNFTVNGDAGVGPNVPYQDAIKVWPQSDITGTQSNFSQEISLPPVTVPENILDSGDLNIGGGSSEVLSGGDYWFSSVKITGNGQLQFSGPATIYVTGDIDIAGNSITTSNNLPANLVFKVAGAHDVKLTGDMDFYGGIYAPESEINLNGNGKVFGAFTAKEVDLNGNVNFHYDEAMKNIPGGAGYLVELNAWHESLSQ